MCFVLFKQQTAYEMRISDWSSDVCSSDLHEQHDRGRAPDSRYFVQPGDEENGRTRAGVIGHGRRRSREGLIQSENDDARRRTADLEIRLRSAAARRRRSEEHTSELQSLMRISYAVFCLKTKNKATGR